jgi:transcriptional regulator
MYATPSARENDREVLIHAVREIQLGALVANSPSGFAASHVPMTVQEVGDELIVESHVARANPLWELAVTGCEALAIFQGPQAYIHPRWMPRAFAEGKAVPTWTYVAVHVQGHLQAIQEETWLRRHLDQLALQNEAHREEPWSVADAPDLLLNSLLKGIVGLQLKVRTLEGSWKMAQGLTETDRLSVIEGLVGSGTPNDQLVAATMKQLMAPKDG